jgi:hypothetical protein
MKSPFRPFAAKASFANGLGVFSHHTYGVVPSTERGA